MMPGDNWSFTRDEGKVYIKLDKIVLTKYGAIKQLFAPETDQSVIKVGFILNNDMFYFLLALL